MTSRLLYALCFAGLLTLGAVFAIGVAMSWLVASYPAASRSLALAALIEVAVYAGFSAWLARDFAAPLTRLGLGSASLQLLLVGAALGFTLHGPADFVQSIVERVLPLPDSVLIERAARLSPSSSVERVVLLLSAAGAVPLAEELFFRGALLAWVERATSFRVAAWVSAACFTLSHAEPRSWPALFLVAGALGLLRWAGHGLRPCILLHATFNATTLVVIFAQPREALGLGQPSWPLFLLGSAASVTLLMLAWRARRALPEKLG